LSSRLAIMTKGGKLACEGSTLQIKNDHGQILHVTLVVKAHELVVDDEFDETNVNMADNEDDKNIRGEIFNQVVWSRTEAIEMLDAKGLHHLAAQIKHVGIFCPSEFIVPQTSDL